MSIAPRKRFAEGIEPLDSSDRPTEPVNKKADRACLQDKYTQVIGGCTLFISPADKNGDELSYATYSADLAKANPKAEGKKMDFSLPHCENCNTDGHSIDFCESGPPLVFCKLCGPKIGTDHVALTCPYAERVYGVVPQEDGTFVHCTDRCYICNKIHDGEPDFDNCPYSDEDDTFEMGF